MKTQNKIIEAGCGTGRILEYLLNTDCKVTGVDISQDMLDKASGKLKHWIDSGDMSLINHNFSFDRINYLFDVASVTTKSFNCIIT